MQAIIFNLAGQVVIDVFECMLGCSRVLLFGVCEHVCLCYVSFTFFFPLVFLGRGRNRTFNRGDIKVNRLELIRTQDTQQRIYNYTEFIWFTYPWKVKRIKEEDIHLITFAEIKFATNIDDSNIYKNKNLSNCLM